MNERITNDLVTIGVAMSSQSSDESGSQVLLGTFPVLSGTGWPEPAGTEHFLCSQALLTEAECFGDTKTVNCPRAPSGNIRRFFSSIHCENLIEPLEVNFTNRWAPL